MNLAEYQPTHEIFELRTETEWAEAWPALQSLRPDLDRETLMARRPQLLKDGYSLFGLMVEGKIAVVAGVQICPHLSYGRDLWIHDLATTERERSQGLGMEMIQFCEEVARQNRCSRICVRARFNNASAQRFLEDKGGYQLLSVAYVKRFGEVERH